MSPFVEINVRVMIPEHIMESSHNLVIKIWISLEVQIIGIPWIIYIAVHIQDESPIEVKGSPSGGSPPYEYEMKLFLGLGQFHDQY